MNIAVFASHGGSDLQAIKDGCKKELINIHKLMFMLKLRKKLRLNS